MTPAPASPYASADALRVSDTERDRAVDMLQTAFAEGRIDHAELDHRVEGALAAVNRADLSTALRGLPLGHPAAAQSTQAVSAHLGATAGPVGPAPTGDERAVALAAHWLGFFTLFIGPALIAASKGKTSRFVRQQAMEAVNFQVTFLGANIVLGVATAFTFGIAGLLFVPLAFIWFILMGVGGLSAAAGNRFTYPWNVRLFS
ncbi:DUF1707 and DUF4870 domain-containing protein [Tenggerimyces flavus]|uniref:DUF1707 and DUF4870 domain-containing protein n=1 Tax=Tenggerimyces flavus TaxID=1708749 RepID=A0ABV7YMY1_9ACTN|nr:DUF1707 and DUF4870 domain-containing protein [Tenggerimyces flavus]MBM7786321.1 putative Tic20 family protein [Tenggerimyces flavus]